MDEQVKSSYTALAAASGLQYDDFHNVIYGQRNGFDLLIYAVNINYPKVLTIHTAAKRSGSALTQWEKEALTKDGQGFTVMDQEGYQLSVVLAKSSSTQEELEAALPEAIDRFLAYLTEKGFQPCCSICGQNEEAVGYLAGETYQHLCQNCESRISGGYLSRAPKGQEKVILGVLGAFLGSLVGVLMIVLLGRIGIVASFSGTVMAVCVLMGYEFFGKKLSKKGIVICVVIMLIMAYVGDRLDWTVLVYQEYGRRLSSMHMSFFECYLAIPGLISRGVIDIGRYVLNLVLLYVFLLIGAVPTINRKVQKSYANTRMIKIGQ